MVRLNNSVIRRFGQWLTALPFLAFLLYVLLSTFSKYESFVGWDTPAYVFSVKILESEGLLSFLHFWEYNRFPYSMILYLLNLMWPQGLFVLARILPILLAVVLVFLVGFLLYYWFKDGYLAILAVVFSCVWIAPYILISNLFDQLLGFVLGLIWLTFAFSPRTKLTESLAYVAFLVASVSHVYTMIFLYAALILSRIIMWISTRGEEKANGDLEDKVKPLMNLIVLGTFLILILVASTLLSGSTRIFSTLLNPQQINETGVRSISSSLVYISFGGYAVFAIPIALFITFYRTTKRQTANQRRKYSYILSWTAVALMLPVVSWLYPYLVSYTERMIIVAPIPILLALFVRDISDLISRKGILKFQSHRISPRAPTLSISSRWVKAAIVSSLVFCLFIVNVGPILDNKDTYLRSFISDDIANRLESLAQSFKFSQKPLFVIDLSTDMLDDYSGLWDNTIGAYIGPHYVYLGPIQNLANFRMTDFNSTMSDIWSAKFFEELLQEGLLSYDSLVNRSIVLLDCFYPLRDYEKPYTNEIQEGIFVLNFEKLYDNRSQIMRIFEDAYSDAAEKIGPWYGVKRDWSSSPYVLELYSNVTGDEKVSYDFDITDGTIYSLNLRYFDFTNLNVSLDFSIDGNLVGYISYLGLGKPVEIEVCKTYLAYGWHELSIHPISQGLLAVDLDYIIIGSQ